MTTRAYRLALRVLAGSILALQASQALAAAAVIYSQPAYESPLRGNPDDLLLLPGYGFAATDKVVYQALTNTTQPLTPPTSVPTNSIANSGVVDIVSTAGVPNSLTVHLPPVMIANQAYALWDLNASGQWSNGIKINDARPLWITPDQAYQSASLANLPRVLKVVGRNLQPGSGKNSVTLVRLVGERTQTTYTLTANNANNDSANTTTELERYVAAVKLPSPMTVDQYTVSVSRDGTSWVPLLGNGQTAAQTFTVTADPVAQTVFKVSQFPDPVTGPCQANDMKDDTGCILLAIRAATAAGGGTVVFDPGVWTMSDAGTWTSGLNYSNRLGTPGSCPPSPQGTCGVTYVGVLVPVGVSLQGAGSSGSNATIIERTSGWPLGLPAFTLQGGNQVSGFEFVDQNNYTSSAAGGPMLQLGLVWYYATLYNASNPTEVSYVTITQNLFDQPYYAIGDGGLPTDHAYITYNTFGGAYVSGIFIGQNTNEAINLGPNPYFPYQTYHFDDSIVAYNTFYPSSYNNTSGQNNGNGTVASQINTGLRVDFSDNTADGTSTQYLYNTSDAKGWRAGYFWSTGANQEMTLMSSNSVICPGDKNGDGEAFAYDGSTTLGGVPAAEPVLAAAAWTDPHGIAGTTVTLQGSLVTDLPTSAGNIDISANPSAYYSGFWVQIVAGTGIGQWRKLESVAIGSNSTGPTVTLNVTPAFDVPPDATSLIMLAHAYWQNATVNNTVDQQTPMCTQANTFQSGGVITWFDSTADSAIEGNLQYDTNGVNLHQDYAPTPAAATLTPAVAEVESANEVYNNLISGKYNWGSQNAASGGIELGYGATASFGSGNLRPAPPPPVMGYGVAVAWNTIIQADTEESTGVGSSSYLPIGGISLGLNWSTGPTDGSGLDQWNLGDTTLVFHNSLQNISQAESGSYPGVAHIGIGVNDPDYEAQTYPYHYPISWRTSLYDNTCSNVDIPVSDNGIGTVRYCPAGLVGSSCECSGPQSSPVDVGIAAAGSGVNVQVGQTQTYTITVTNHSTSASSSGVTVLLTPAAGIGFPAASLVPSQGGCDVSVNSCSLGVLAAGKSATVTVSALVTAVGTWPLSFAVTHQEADPDAANDAAIVSNTAFMPLAAPTGLAATPSGPGQISLSWSGIGSTASDYYVFYGTASGGENIKSPAVVGTSTTLYALPASTNYYFVVKAYNHTSGFTGPASNEVSAVVAPLTAPANLTATAGNAQVTLSWTASPGASDYYVYTTPAGSGTIKSAAITGTTGTITGLNKGTAYSFVVEAYNHANSITSAPSNAASATPN